MSHRNQIERIEEYHTGNMTSEEISLFEKDLSADPSLKAESDFQADIINGVRDYRKLQLKSRLDAIDVSPGWIEFVQQSTLVKSFGGIAIATLIGSGVFFLAENSSTEEISSELSSVENQIIYGPEIETLNYQWTITVPENVSVVIASEEKERTEIPTSTSLAANPNVSNDKEIKIVLSPEPVAEQYNPDFKAPDAGEVVEEQELSAIALDKVPEASKVDSEDKPIKVETKNTKNSKIRYKYYDGKLFLNGNFNKEPYEILEINSASGRRIYLLHHRKYYEVRTTDKLTELPEVTNVKLIQELRLIQENK